MLRTIDLGDCGAYKGGGSSLGVEALFEVASVYSRGKTGRENQLRKKERKEVRVSYGERGKEDPERIKRVVLMIRPKSKVG